MKRAIALLTAALLLVGALAACGNKNDQKATEAATTAATEASKTTATEAANIIETTAEGGTVEKTADNFTGEKDKNGEIVSVKDSSGNSVPVQEYIEEHTSGNNSGNTSNNTSSKSSDNSGNQGTSSQPSSSSKPQDSSKSDQEVEETIPQIIIELPDTEEYELPII